MLTYPAVLRAICVAAAAVGVAAAFVWMVPFYTQNAPFPTFAFLLICLAPIGIGIFLMTFEQIYVSEDTIESRFLGYRRRLDLRTAEVKRMNGALYVIQDASGKQLTVRLWMRGSQELFTLLTGAKLSV